MASLRYNLWIIQNFKKVLQIPKTSVSDVQFGMKSNEVSQLKFSLNASNLELNQLLINDPNLKIQLDLNESSNLFYIAKHSQADKNQYNVNCVADFYKIKYVQNPLQNQTYSGSVFALISRLVPNWEVRQINDLDASVSISVGSDDILSTIEKAIESTGWSWRITTYSSESEPCLEYGEADQIAEIKAQFSNHDVHSNFGDKNRIISFATTVSNEYTSQIQAFGKFDGGNLPEFDLTGYELADESYPAASGYVFDQSLQSLDPKIQVKKFTVPKTLSLVQAKDYLYQAAKNQLIAINSRLVEYKLEIKTDQFLQPLDKILVFHNKKTQTKSRSFVERTNTIKVISAIQYNLDTNTVALTLSTRGKFKYSDTRANILDLNKQVKTLTQST